MRYLVQNKELCRKCGTCSRLLPDFVRKHKGELMVSDGSYRREEVRASIDSVINACPAGAISFS